MKKYLLSFVLGCSVLSLDAAGRIEKGFLDINKPSDDQTAMGRGKPRENPFLEFHRGNVDSTPPGTFTDGQEPGQTLQHLAPVPGQGGNNGVTLVSGEPGTTARATGAQDATVGNALVEVGPTVFGNSAGVAPFQVPVEAVQVVSARLTELKNAFPVKNPDPRIQQEVIERILGEDIQKFPEGLKEPLQSVLELLLSVVQGNKEAIPALKSALAKVPIVEGPAKDALVLFKDAVQKFAKRNTLKKTGTNVDFSTKGTRIIQADSSQGDQFKQWLKQKGSEDFANVDLDHLLAVIEIPSLPEGQSMQEWSTDEFLTQSFKVSNALYDVNHIVDGKLVKKVANKTVTKGVSEGDREITKSINLGIDDTQQALLTAFIEEQREELGNAFLAKYQGQNSAEIVQSSDGRQQLAVEQKILEELLGITEGKGEMVTQKLQKDFKVFPNSDPLSMFYKSIRVELLGYELQTVGIEGADPERSLSSIGELMELYEKDEENRSRIRDIIEQNTKLSSSLKKELQNYFKGVDDKIGMGDLYALQEKVKSVYLTDLLEALKLDMLNGDIGYEQRLNDLLKIFGEFRSRNDRLKISDFIDTQELGIPHSLKEFIVRICREDKVVKVGLPKGFVELCGRISKELVANSSFREFFEKNIKDLSASDVESYLEVIRQLDLETSPTLKMFLRQSLEAYSSIKSKEAYLETLRKVMTPLGQMLQKDASFRTLFDQNVDTISLGDITALIEVEKELERFVSPTYGEHLTSQEVFQKKMTITMEYLLRSYDSSAIRKLITTKFTKYLEQLAAKDPKRSKFIKQMLADYERVQTLQGKVEDMKKNPQVDDALELTFQMNKLLNTIGLRKWYLGDRKTYNDLQQVFTGKVQSLMERSINELSNFNGLVGAKKRKYAWGIPVLRALAEQFTELITIPDAFKALFTNAGVYNTPLDTSALYDNSENRVATYTRNLQEVTQTLTEINSPGNKLPQFPSVQDLQARLESFEYSVELINKTRTQFKALDALEKMGKGFNTEAFLNKNGLNTLDTFIANMQANPSYVPTSKDDLNLEWINPTERESFYYLCASPATRPFALSIARSALTGQITLPVEAIARAKEILNKLNEVRMEFDGSRPAWLEADTKEIEVLKARLAATASASVSA